MKIAQRTINSESPCFIIAEAGVNHDGSEERALELVRAAKESGADCVKFQTFTADAVATLSAPKAQYQLGTTDPGQSQHAMLKGLELPLSAYAKVLSLCDELGIVFLSTPYAESDALFLRDLGAPGFKIASGQLVEHRFLQGVADLKLPLIISTGMATMSEVASAVEVIRGTGSKELAVLQCTTNYPAAAEDSNLRAMVSIREALDVTVGYSDHVMANYSCYAAVAMGARIIEKHLTLDSSAPGPDHLCSLEPQGFAELVTGIRTIESALGSAVKSPSTCEIENTEGMRRSIVLARALKAGQRISDSDLAFKRPATGIAPKDIRILVDKRVVRDLPENHRITLEDLLWER